ncbi:hypothetical protein [Burkholderia sp. BCC1998]|uniref:hypothetical protein n=1 Tax=Burkholderia sp. BCC1998 TaxID=2817447 RepID=UPI002AB74FE9|nr:hypothetical protein [Burkholderia sp. BCC1998]
MDIHKKATPAEQTAIHIAPFYRINWKIDRSHQLQHAPSSSAPSLFDDPIRLQLNFLLNQVRTLINFLLRMTHRHPPEIQSDFHLGAYGKATKLGHLERISNVHPLLY